MPVSGEQILQGLADIAGMMGPMLQAAQCQQVLMTPMLQTMSERDAGEGQVRRVVREWQRL